MALNFAGIGYAFGGRDAGLLSLQAKVVRGFKKIEESRIAADPSKFFEGIEEAAKKAAAGPLSGMEDAQNAVSEATERSANLIDRFRDSVKKNLGDSRAPINRTRDDISTLADVLERLNELVRQSKLRTFLQSLGLAQLNDLARSFQEVASEGLNLTTSLEGQFVQMAKSTRGLSTSLAGNSDEARKLERRWANLAIELNTGVEGIAAADAAFRRAGVSLKDLGLDLRTYVKTAEAAGADPGDLARSISKMAGTWGMTGEQIREVLDSVAASGKFFGNTAGAIRGFSGILGTINDEFLKLARASAGGVAGALKSVSALSGVFLKLGESEDEATQKSVEIFQQLMQARQGFQEMFTGLQSEAPQLFEELGIGFGDAGQALEMLQESPLEFAKNIVLMTKRMREMGLEGTPQFARLQQVLGRDVPALRALIQAGDGVADALEGAAKASDQASGEFSKFGKSAFTTGRTLDERLGLAQERFIARVRAQTDAGRKFVRDTELAYRQFGDIVTDVAKDRGPLGTLLKKMAAVHQFGAKALLPGSLQPMAQIFGSVAKEAAPVIGALGSMGFRLKMLLNPFALVSAAAGGFAAMLAGALTKKAKVKGKWKIVRVPLDQALDDVAKKIVWWANSVAGTLDKFASNFPTYLDKALKFFGKLADKIPWKQLEDAFSKIYRALADKLGPPLKKLFVEVASAAFDALVDGIKGYFKGLFSDLGNIWSSESTSFSDKAAASFKSLAPALLGSLVFELKVFPLGRIMSNIFGPAFSFGIKNAMKLAGSGLSMLDDLMEGTARRILGMFSPRPGPRSNVLGNALSRLGGALRGFAGRVGGFSQSIYSAILQTSLAQKAASAATSAWGAVTNSVSGMGVKLSGVLGELAPKFAGLTSKVGAAIPAFAKTTGALLGKAGLVAAAGLAGWELGRFIGQLKIGSKTIDEYVQDAYAWIADLFASITSMFDTQEERAEKLYEQVFGKASVEQRDKLLTGIEAAVRASVRGEATQKQLRLLAGFATASKREALVELLSMRGVAPKTMIEEAIKKATKNQTFRPAKKTVKESAPKIEFQPLEQTFVMPATIESLPALNAIRDATNNPAWYRERFEPLAKEMVRHLRTLASATGKPGANIGLGHRTAATTTGAPL